MDEIDQRNERICNGILYIPRGRYAIEDRRKEHEPTEMVYVGLGNKDSDTEEIEPFYIFECPTCGHLRSV